MGKGVRLVCPVPARGMGFDSVARVGSLTADSKRAAAETRRTSIIFLNAVNCNFAGTACRL